MWLVLMAFLAQSADFQADGIKALDAKQYDSAASLFTQAIAADPKDYASHFYLGLTDSLLHKDSEAVPHYQAALDLKPGLYEAEINLGISLLRMKDADGAIPHLRAAADQKPKEAQPNYFLGAALLEKGQNSDAEPAFTRAIAADPQSAPAELGLGQAMARQGRLTDGEPHYRKAIALDASYKDTLFELAALYEKAHQNGPAVAIYREFPANPGALEHLGVLLSDSGKSDEAIPVLENAVARSPSVANRVALAQAYLDHKQPDKANALLAEAVRVEPQTYDLRMFYGRTLRDQHKYLEAASQFLAAAQIKPASVESWNELSASLILAEQYPQALAALDRIRALGAETAGHYFARALALDHLRELKEALVNYNKFLEMSQGKSPDEEFKARQRAKTIQHELEKR